MILLIWWYCHLSPCLFELVFDVLYEGGVVTRLVGLLVHHLLQVHHALQ
jgi:hypothetical protein